MKSIRFTVTQLLMFVACCSQIFGQKKQLTPAVGDPAPGYVFKTLINSSIKTATISSFKGKYLILDFWGTWCGSCLEAIPREDSLQKKYQGKLQFLMVSSEKPAVLQRFFNKANKSTKLSLPSVSDESWKLAQQFKVRYVPHYVWIDKKGIISAITGAEEITWKNIDAFINGDNISLPVKEDDQRIEFNYDRPFMADSNFLNPADVVSYHILTPFVKGLYCLQSIPRTGIFADRRILATNTTIAGLYRTAYGANELYDYYPFYRTIVNVKDALRINPSTAEVWNKYKDKYGLCYDLIISKGNRNELFKAMRTDLDQLYGLKITIEKRPMPCLVLKITRHGLLETKGGKPSEENNQFSMQLVNKSIGALCSGIYEIVQSKNATAIIDETNYPSNIDIKINADLKNLGALNKELEKYGLSLQQAVREVEVLVIADP